MALSPSPSWAYEENAFNKAFFDAAIDRLSVPTPSSAFLAAHPGFSSHKSPVCVRWINPSIGKGLFASRDIVEGEPLFSEKPLSSIQDAINKTLCETCGHCHAFLDSLKRQILTILRSEECSMDVCDDDVALPFLSLYSEKHPKREREGERETERERAGGELSDVVVCKFGCDEKYCSVKCRDTAAYMHHELLCWRGDTTHPMFHFEKFAVRHSDHLRLAAQVIAIEVNARERGVCVSADNSDPISVCVMGARSLAKKLWWNIHPYDPNPCGMHDEEDEEEDEVGSMGHTEEEQRDYLHRMMTSASKLLGVAIDPNGRHRDLLSADHLGLVMGSIDLNSADMVVPSPLSHYMRFLSTLPANERGEAASVLKHTMERLNAALQEEDEEDEEERPAAESIHSLIDDVHDESTEREAEIGWQRDFPHCSGVGLYTVMSTINHSCTPNAFLYKREGFDTDDSVVLFAKRNISAGEEITIAYVEETLPYEDRVDLLTSPYLFSCPCVLCTEKK